MLIRSFQRRDMRKKHIFTAIWLCILGLIIRGIVSIVKNHEQQQIQLPTKNLHEGQTISFKGEIESTNKFPIYTHTIKNQDGVKMYLKSSSINLKTYENQTITLKGDIKEIYKGTPLVEVHEAQINDEGLAVKDNKYIFSKDLLILDFKGQSQLSAKRTDKEIEVYYGDEKIVSIERFSCSNLFKNNSCDDLIKDYEEKDKDAFTSYYGYTYFKHGTGEWTMFDENQFGYLFKGISDDMMLNISSNIKIIDADDIIDIQENNIKQECGFKQIEIGNIIEKNIKEILLEVKGETQNDESGICNISFDTENEWKIIETKI